MIKDLHIKKGMLLTLQHGRYSETNDVGPFLVRKDFYQRDVVSSFYSSWKPVKYQELVRSTPNFDEFISFLENNGFIERTPIDQVLTWDLGGDNFAPEINIEETEKVG